MIRFVNKLAVFWVKTPIFGENIFRIIVSVPDPLLKIYLQICIDVGKGEIYAFVPFIISARQFHSTTSFST
jgi:hypothetical protein